MRACSLGLKLHHKIRFHRLLWYRNIQIGSFLINNQNWCENSNVDGQCELTSQNAFTVSICIFVLNKSCLCKYSHAWIHGNLEDEDACQRIHHWPQGKRVVTIIIIMTPSIKEMLDRMLSAPIDITQYPRQPHKYVSLFLALYRQENTASKKLKTQLSFYR